MPYFRADQVDETVWQWVKWIMQHPDQLAAGLQAEKAEAEHADLSEHIQQRILTDEQITEMETDCREVRDGLDHATLEDKRRYFDRLDVRGKLAIETDENDTVEKVVYAKCRIGEQRLSLAPTSPSSNTGATAITVCGCHQIRRCP